MAETRLGIDDLIWPTFVHEGPEDRAEVGTFPGVYRLSVPRLVDEVGEAAALGIPMVAVFPVTGSALKTPDGEEVPMVVWAGRWRRRCCFPGRDPRTPRG